VLERAASKDADFTCFDTVGELLNELQSAAKEIGNDELYLTFSEGAKLIQRDIVYAPSLYLES